MWVVDQTAGADVVQNLNLAVSDPASQPYVTAVGGTSLTALGPAPTETTWNDQLNFAEGAGGGGISKTFSMPAYQQPLGTVTGSSGTPCSNQAGDCREIPDVSADADPSTGLRHLRRSVRRVGMETIGGTSGAAPLWAAVLAVASSADGNTTGYGAMNPILYQSGATIAAARTSTTSRRGTTTTTAQRRAVQRGERLRHGDRVGDTRDVAIATGLTVIPSTWLSSGTQVFGGSPAFTATPDFGGSTGSVPFGVTVTTTGFTCTEVGSSTTISPSLPVGSDTLLASSCSGATLGRSQCRGLHDRLHERPERLHRHANPADVAVTGSQSYGGSPVLSGSAANPPAGITVTTTDVTCTVLEPFTFISTGLAAGSRTLLPASCSGATLSGTDAANYAPFYTSVPGDFTIVPAPLTVTASSGSMTYGGTTPTITPEYSGFENGDTPSSLTAAPDCSSAATSASPVAGSPYASTCTSAVDPNYSFTYVPGSVSVGPAPLTITASSPSMEYGTTPPAITPLYSGLMNNDTGASLTTQPSCMTNATNTDPPSPPTYANSCSGAADSNYTITYAPGATTVDPAPVDVAVNGSQAWGGSPGFTGSGPTQLPAGVSGLDMSGLSCSQVAPSTPISPTLGGGTYTLVPGSCGGVTMNGSSTTDYTVVFTSASGDFSVTGGPPPPPPPPPPAPHGYYLVGSDGGIFTFGSATFYGSTGSLRLQRPVVGITPTADEGGYWLVASDGGIFAFGNAGFHGSIPGLGLAPAGSGVPHALNAPIVGMVPSADGGGYFMVASDGGVFAFGDAQFEGSCPGIGGCSGSAVAVVPDATGRGYWLVTSTGHVYTFGDAPYFGVPGAQGSPITGAVRTADGRGYFVLLANGTVDGYGDAVSLGGPTGAVGGFNPASAIFTDVGGGGYWVASAAGGVFTYGDAPNDGSMAGTHLNGPIIAGTGF